MFSSFCESFQPNSCRKLLLSHNHRALHPYYSPGADQLVARNRSSVPYTSCRSLTSISWICRCYSQVWVLLLRIPATARIPATLSRPPRQSRCFSTPIPKFQHWFRSTYSHSANQPVFFSDASFSATNGSPTLIFLFHSIRYAFLSRYSR